MNNCLLLYKEWWWWCGRVSAAALSSQSVSRALWVTTLGLEAPAQPSEVEVEDRKIFLEVPLTVNNSCFFKCSRIPSRWRHSYVLLCRERLGCFFSLIEIWFWRDYEGHCEVHIGYLLIVSKIILDSRIVFGKATHGLHHSQQPGFFIKKTRVFLNFLFVARFLHCDVFKVFSHPYSDAQWLVPTILSNSFGVNSSCIDYFWAEYFDVRASWWLFMSQKMRPPSV